MEGKLNDDVMQKVMDRAMLIDEDCPELCRNFKIMESALWPGSLILRWTTINLEDEDRPVQCFRYECFDEEGESRYCSIYYVNTQEANEFFASLKPLHTQVFSGDHQL